MPILLPQKGSPQEYSPFHSYGKLKDIDVITSEKLLIGKDFQAGRDLLFCEKG
jgi:hypothetical protein